jgi:asparagine synthase (glutamine-hydrolysing)
LGLWVDDAADLGLAHSRLAILDLSSAGRQPMMSACNRYVITFNGEIYNYRALHQELEALGTVFRSHSDTEVILAAVSQWGLTDSLKRFVGMFAFALWDRKEQILHLARDRMGEKPLFYGYVDGSFVFASGIGALKALLPWHYELEAEALALFLRHNYIPAPYSVYKGIYKLIPGASLSLSRIALDSLLSPKVNRYWSLSNVIRSGLDAPFRGDAQEALDQIETILLRSVGQQMVADVPLGAFLSGGVDSSLITSLMQAQSTQPVKTFTIGFEEGAYDEAQYARAVARHLGTNHTELYVSAKDARAVIPQLPFIYDEPFADSSQIPTYLLSKITRRHVTVSLSGDGGDELFGGYERYRSAARVWKAMNLIPNCLRTAAALVLAQIPLALLDIVVPAGVAPRGKTRLGARVKERLHRLRYALSLRNRGKFYVSLMSFWGDGILSLKNGETRCDLSTLIPAEEGTSFMEEMMFIDMLTYLPDDILVKLDRASMAVSLECRVPMLDHRLIEFVWQLPSFMKAGSRDPKALLKKLLYRYLPRGLFERPKMGFGIPLGDWLRGPLRDWAEDLLSVDRLRNEGILNPAMVRRKWEEHLAGGWNCHYPLWNVLMLEAWLAAQ